LALLWITVFALHVRQIVLTGSPSRRSTPGRPGEPDGYPTVGAYRPRLHGEHRARDRRSPAPGGHGDLAGRRIPGRLRRNARGDRPSLHVPVTLRAPWRSTPRCCSRCDGRPSPGTDPGPAGHRGHRRPGVARGHPTSSRHGCSSPRR
jgi:hypothetical protein